MIKRIIKENIGPFFMASFVTGTCVGGYFYQRAEKNLKEYENKLFDENARDSTRSTNEFFGLNWGFAADNIVYYSLNKIKDKLDSGDLIFFKYNCIECLNVTGKL